MRKFIKTKKREQDQLNDIVNLSNLQKKLGHTIITFAVEFIDEQIELFGSII